MLLKFMLRFKNLCVWVSITNSALEDLNAATDGPNKALEDP